MTIRKYARPLLAVAVVGLVANIVWALGFQLGESKAELKLEYDVKVVDHGTGRVTVVLTLADEGRLRPLSAIQLMVPSSDGTNHVDMSVAVGTRKVDGKEVARVHLLRKTAERAQLQLRTWHFDGKQEPLTWYYHVIELKDYLPAKKKPVEKE